MTLEELAKYLLTRYPGKEVSIAAHVRAWPFTAASSGGVLVNYTVFGSREGQCDINLPSLGTAIAKLDSYFAPPVAVSPLEVEVPS